MASIQERNTKSGKYYYLAERKGATPIYLGTKAPWPQSQGWKNLSQEQVQRAKRKAARRLGARREKVGVFTNILNVECV